MSIKKEEFVQSEGTSVYGPHAVWHLGGSHKLKKYGIVMHGVIDDYSRFVLALRASDSNDKFQVLSTFILGCDKVQGKIPSLVKINHGGENRAVYQFMLLHRGFEAPLSVSAGSGIHNQRIGRLWRDVNQNTTTYFESLFDHMQNIGVLSLDNECDLFILHFMFIPDINNSLDQFIGGWNNHTMSIKNQRSGTPIQKLFACTHLEDNIMYYDSDNIERATEDDFADDQVVVTPMRNPFNDDEYVLFQQELDRNNAEIQQYDSQDMKVKKYIFARNVMDIILMNGV